MKWSYSAHMARRQRQRRFAFAQIMASHNAKAPERREAFVLKQLQHLSAWQGSLVHHVLATDFLSAVRTRDRADVAALTSRAQRLAERQFSFSAARRYRDVDQTKGAAGEDYCALFEHEYGWEIADQALDRAQANIVRCFQNLVTQTEFLDHLYAGSGHVAESLRHFELNGTTISATLDLFFWQRDGQPAIVDWKIAESDTSDYSRQFLVYALAVARGRPQPGNMSTVDVWEANLLKNQIRRYSLGADHLEEAEDFIYRSLVEQEALVGGGRFADLNLADLDVAERSNTCSYCNFRSLCLRELEAEDEVVEADVTWENWA